MRRLVLVLATLAATGLAGLLPAAGGVAQPQVVSANPVDWTPHVLDGVVNAMTVVGNRVYVGGRFSRVQAAGSVSSVPRANLFSFQLGTGQIDPAFAPSVNGTVLALAAGTDGTVYAGGSFSAVNGLSTPALVRLSGANGGVITTFTPRVAGGEVHALALRATRLYLGGAFTTVGGVSRPALARVSPTNGALDNTFNLQVSSPRSGRLRVEAMALSSGGTGLIVDGTFTRMAGQPRYQIAFIDTGAVPARLTGWSTQQYGDQCAPAFDTYLRGIDFAPDNSYFVVVATGQYSGPTKMCDSAARWENTGTANSQATWVNRTGGDSLYAVSVTGSAVYVGGHQRWMDNPFGHESPGPGAVSREGIAAVHPITGRALSWNPTRTRGVGVQSLVSYPGGLLVGSDTAQIGHEYHARVAAFPVS